jgi:hypothetical protein
MPRVTTVDRWSYSVVPARVFLVHATFAEREGPNTEPKPFPEEGEVLLGLSLYRRSALKLTVGIEASLGEESPFDVRVLYAVDMEMHDVVPEENRDAIWKHAALNIAPGLLYPYLRETISSLTERSRGETFVLPFVPLPLDGMEDIEIPAPPIPSEDQAELPLHAAAG